MCASDWSKYKWWRGWGAGPTRPIPTSTQHLFANFLLFDKAEHIVSPPEGGGVNLCHTGRVEFELYNKCEYWMNLTSIDLDTGNPSSQSRIFS